MRADIADIYAEYHFESGVKKLHDPGHPAMLMCERCTMAVLAFRRLSYCRSCDNIENHGTRRATRLSLIEG